MMAVLMWQIKILLKTQKRVPGNIGESISINEKRFGINDQLSQIFRNTIHLIEVLEQSE
jgi:hypothetical protein